LSDCFYNPGDEGGPTAMGIMRTNGLPCGKNGEGVFAKFSRINHSCCPNSNHMWSEGGLEERLFALVDIPKEAEITTSYLTGDELLSSRQERRNVLMEKFRFQCRCRACALSDYSVKESDRRRRRCLDCYRKIQSISLSSEERPSLSCNADSTNELVEKIDAILNEGLDLMEQESLYQNVVKAALCLEAHRSVVEAGGPLSALKARQWMKQAYQFSAIARGYDDHMTVRLKYALEAQGPDHNISAIVPCNNETCSA